MESNKHQEKWNNRRSEILHRDNYTCQCCHTFNPQLGLVELYRKGNMSLEQHWYESTPRSSTYHIASTATGLTITIEFGETWLVLPILQVHHKRYIENRERWDYEDSDLITLCKECHSLIHENMSIPIFGENGSLISKRKYIPNDSGSGRVYNAAPWNFVKFRYEVGMKREYQVADIEPKLSYGLMALNAEDINEQTVKDGDNKASAMFEDFIQQFLPHYKKKQ